MGIDGAADLSNQVIRKAEIIKQKIRVGEAEIRHLKSPEEISLKGHNQHPGQDPELQTKSHHQLNLLYHLQEIWI